MSAGVPGSRLVCSGCGAAPPPEEPFPFRCPAAVRGDDIDHVLVRELQLAGTRFPAAGEPQPFVRFRELLHSYRTAIARGMQDEEYVEQVRGLDRAVARVDGRGFVQTPYARSDALSEVLGFSSKGGVWVKDETGGVAGSHKGRHLMGVALYLLVAELTELAPAARPRLAVASCGNAALAAAVVARALRRELSVFVPADADPAVLQRLGELGAEVIRCERAPQDAPGDPCLQRLHEALSAGALPFTCQGPECGLAIEGGQTLVWELVGQHAAAGAAPLRRLIVPVGGGALGSSVARGLWEARELGFLRRLPRLHPVQAVGANPFQRAWERIVEGTLARLAEKGVAPTRGEHLPGFRGDRSWWTSSHAVAEAVREELAFAARHRSRFMWPWEERPRSVASGILDDETYDWRALAWGLFETGGHPLTVADAVLERACDLAREATGAPVDATGAASLAGLLVLKELRVLDPGENVALLFTGAAR